MGEYCPLTSQSDCRFFMLLLSHYNKCILYRYTVHFSTTRFYVHVDVHVHVLHNHILDVHVSNMFVQYTCMYMYYSVYNHVLKCLFILFTFTTCTCIHVNLCYRHVHDVCIDMYGGFVYDVHVHLYMCLSWPITFGTSSNCY